MERHVLKSPPVEGALWKIRGTPGGPGGVEEEHIWGLETTARGGHGLGCATSQHLVFATLQNTQECGFSYGETVFF